MIRLTAFVQEGRLSYQMQTSALEGGIHSGLQLKVFCVSWAVVGTISLYTGADNNSTVITGELNSTQLAFREHLGLWLLLSGQHFLGIHPICSDLHKVKIPNYSLLQ